MLLPKQSAIIILIAAVAVLANEEKNLSEEQPREVEIDDLISSLEERMKANRASSAESGPVTISSGHEKRDLRAATEGQIIDAPVQVPIKPWLHGQDHGVRYDEEADESKAAWTSGRGKEPSKKPTAPKKTQRSPTQSELEKDEAYYKSLLRLQNLYRLYNKRYLDGDVPHSDPRPSRHCTDSSSSSSFVARKYDRISAKRARYIERSRTLADRIAEAAMKLVRKKGCMIDCLHSACGCGRNRAESVIIVEPEPVVVESEAATYVEPTKRRDTTVAAASSSASEVATSIDLGGVSIDTAASSSASSATSVGTGSAGASASASSQASSDVRVGSSVSSSASAGGEVKYGDIFWGQIRSCDDYERKMVMDMAIEEAAGMIRNLAYETRASVPPRTDPMYERNILKLAIDLVNKVTSGTSGDRLDVFGDFRYKNVDDYLKASIADSEYVPEYATNAGFDYASTGRQMYDDPDGIDDYGGYPSPYSRGRCDTCAKYDITLGNRCPLCKRSGHMFQGRMKRHDAQLDKGKIYHIEQLPEVQSKVNV